ncbi:MAG TPA: chemotaxis response regulator protein-glutamate methylesterase [Spirochaetota bacterium]|nr:chemotaxis response regulator protein-glutamate methylesterase [Spirochaetota bacterium]HOL56517.1 chemotaxis response regulator protein-glutamate methylesterase [Spirochaetota bacterium]HPP03941.1 chemotaxis response regulator protein-glutamate methylesterase [Spirochaetota bacterium]
MESKIKVMVVDDSALIRNLVTKELSKSSLIEVVGTAINGRFALNKLDKLQPDIIILDLEMPEMNGIEFLQERQKLGINTPVIILSAHAKKGAKITLEALALGASDFILKPSEPGVNLDEIGNKLIEMIHALAKPLSYKSILNEKKEEIINLKPLYEPITVPKIDIESHLQPIKRIPDIHIVVIGISTGGPNALREILPLFPENFPVPIAIVQHMPPGFTLEFANSLDKICKLRVKEANNDDIVKPGRILIAPGNRHIKFLKKALATVVQLDDSEPVNGHKPSADVLFESAADVFGENTLACIMTGMGKDGATNIGLILKKGGITIAQDQETSIVFGMPKVAIEKNNIQLVRPLNKIAETIIQIVMNKKIV